MKFCSACSSILSPNTTSGNLVFICRCKTTYPAEDADTLIYTETQSASTSSDKYDTLIKLSPFDAASNKVNVVCRKCFAPYLTLIYTTTEEIASYTCPCGAIYDVQSIMADLHVGGMASETTVETTQNITDNKVETTQNITETVKTTQNVAKTISSDKQLRDIFYDKKYKAELKLFSKVILNTVLYGLNKLQDDILKKIIQLLNQPDMQQSDKLIYKSLRAYIHETIYKSPEYVKFKNDKGLTYRSDSRTADIKKLAMGKFDNLKIVSYCDIGCSDGSITLATAEWLQKISKSPNMAITGCDIRKDPKLDAKISFTMLTNGENWKLPYADASQTIITTFMVLHHISANSAGIDYVGQEIKSVIKSNEDVDKNLVLSLREIHRVISPGGYFIVREHDISQDDPYAMLIDIQHYMYAMVWPEVPEYLEYVEKINYKSRDKWIELITSTGFKLVAETPTNGASKQFYMLFTR